MRRKLADDEREMEKQRQREKAGSVGRRGRGGGRVGDREKIECYFKRKSAPCWSSANTSDLDMAVDGEGSMLCSTLTSALPSGASWDPNRYDGISAPVFKLHEHTLTRDMLLAPGVPIFIDE